MTWPLLLLLLFFSFCLCPVSATIPVNAQVLTPTDPLVLHLLDLCLTDQLCTSKWYLPPPPQIDPPSDYLKNKFTRLLINFAYKSLASPDGTLVTVPAWQNDPTLANAALLDPLVQSSLESNADAYWLLLMRSAVFCGGQPNQDFLLGRGCICVPGAVCSEGSGSFSVLQFVALAVIMLVCVINISWSSWQIVQDIGATLSLISAVTSAFNMSRSIPTLDLSVHSLTDEYAQPQSVSVESWIKSKNS